MSKKLLAVSLFTLALAACGSPKKAADDASQPKQGGGPDGNAGGHSIATQDFYNLCVAQPGGFLPADDADHCIVPHTKHIDKGATGIVPIFLASAGNFLVSDGTRGAVLVTLNGRRIADVHGARLPLSQAGTVAFQVLLETESEASAVVYSCFDRFSDDLTKMRPVFCDSSKIP